MTQFIAGTLDLLKLEIATEFDRPPQGPALVYACTSAELPSASDYEGGVLRVTDINGGLGMLAFSNGSAWIRCDTGAAI